VEGFDHLGRVAADEAAGRNIFYDDGAGGDYRFVADGQTRGDDGAGHDPDALADLGGRIIRVNMKSALRRPYPDAVFADHPETTFRALFR
jgi:hypothetical protein